jgi:hypothetical protein
LPAARKDSISMTELTLGIGVLLEAASDVGLGARILALVTRE